MSTEVFLVLSLLLLLGITTHDLALLSVAKREPLGASLRHGFDEPWSSLRFGSWGRSWTSEAFVGSFRFSGEPLLHGRIDGCGRGKSFAHKSLSFGLKYFCFRGIGRNSRNFHCIELQFIYLFCAPKFGLRHKGQKTFGLLHICFTGPQEATNFPTVFGINVRICLQPTPNQRAYWKNRRQDKPDKQDKICFFLKVIFWYFVFPAQSWLTGLGVCQRILLRRGLGRVAVLLSRLGGEGREGCLLLSDSKASFQQGSNQRCVDLYWNLKDYYDLVNVVVKY